jgi:hypothetical protein
VTRAADPVTPGVASTVVLGHTPRVLLFLLLGTYPYVLLLTWALAIYLTWIEAREQQMDKLHKIWWLQLTFLFHFLGYLVLRFWVFYRRHRATA